MGQYPHHIPVLRDEVLELLQPAGRGVLVDCTIGAGGHAEAMLNAAGEQAQLIGLDADYDNLSLAKKRLSPFAERVRLFHANFSQLPDVLAETGTPVVDVLLADLGISSMQVDDATRGFSFSGDGPLDMRMDRSTGNTAGYLVNSMDETLLANLIYANGEERYSRRIAKAIVIARRENPIETTGRLASLVRGAYPPAARRSRRGVHPATRTFQALRIAVNDELGSLDRLLAMLPDVLAPGGRAAVISFHSLEDRRVKHAFADMVSAGAAERLTKKPITASADQVQNNPRSRSAKLRGIEWIRSNGG